MPSATTPVSLRERLLEGLQEVVGSRLTAAGHEPLSVALDWNPRPEHGDLASNCGFQLAARMKQPPPALAAAIADDFNAVPQLSELAHAEAAGGYLNLRLHPAAATAELPRIIEAGADFGRSSAGAGQRVQVEFVSVNPTGPLHVAHGRHAAVGDSLARILEFTGHAVTREFYSNDTGNQVRLFGESILARWLQSQGQDAPVPDGGYQGAYVADLAQAAELELGGELRAALGGAVREPLIERLSRWGVAHMEAQFRELLLRMEVVFDSWFSEATLYGHGWEQETLRLLRDRGHVTERDGATWITRAPDDEGFVIYKSDGEPTYIFKDLLYHRDKFSRRGFERVIDLLGADHHAESQRVRTGLEAMGIDAAQLEVILVQFVHLRRGGETVKMSKRAGEFELLSSLIDEVGADAVRYTFLQRTPDSTMEFDIDLARRQSNENPVFYAQYASARLHNVMAIAGAKAEADPAAADLSLLATEWEQDLLRHLLQFPEVVALAARGREPHRVIYYTNDLAQRIHVFYKNCRVLGSEPPLEAARLVLCRAALTVLRNALGLAGVSAPAQM